MKPKNKITVIIASLILVFGYLYAPTTNINEAKADDDLEICSLAYPNMPDPCTESEVNCYCEIIVTPD